MCIKQPKKNNNIHTPFFKPSSIEYVHKFLSILICGVYCKFLTPSVTFCSFRKDRNTISISIEIYKIYRPKHKATHRPVKISIVLMFIFHKFYLRFGTEYAGSFFLNKIKRYHKPYFYNIMFKEHRDMVFNMKFFPFFLI